MTSATAQALAAPAGAAASGLFGIVSTALNNRAQRRLSMDMYNLSRRDALADWERENAYNSPAAQMARFKAAGLNPNLIYGQNNEAGSVRQGQMDVPNLQPLPSPDFMGGVMGYTQVKQQQAQTNLTEQAIRNAQIDAELKVSQIINNYLSADTKGFDLGLKRELKQTTIESAYSQLERLQSLNAINWQAFEQRGQSFPLQQALRQADLKKTGQEILLLNARTDQSRAQTRKIDADIRALDRLDFEARMTQDERLKVAGIVNRMMEKKIKGQDISNEIEDFRRAMMQVDKGMEYFRIITGGVSQLAPQKPR